MGTPVSPHGHAGKAVTSCGITKTAASVPVRIEVRHGRVACAAAMSVERKIRQRDPGGPRPG